MASNVEKNSGSVPKTDSGRSTRLEEIQKAMAAAKKEGEIKNRLKAIQQGLDEAKLAPAPPKIVPVMTKPLYNGQQSISAAFKSQNIQAQKIKALVEQQVIKRKGVWEEETREIHKKTRAEGLPGNIAVVEKTATLHDSLISSLKRGVDSFVSSEGVAIRVTEKTTKEVTIRAEAASEDIDYQCVVKQRQIVPDASDKENTKSIQPLTLASDITTDSSTSHISAPKPSSDTILTPNARPTSLTSRDDHDHEIHGTLPWPIARLSEQAKKTDRESRRKKKAEAGFRYPDPNAPRTPERIAEVKRNIAHAKRIQNPPTTNPFTLAVRAFIESRQRTEAELNAFIEQYRKDHNVPRNPFGTELRK
ncbi:hypothetical protein C8J56DRAFT_174128 [Mycena floridula]|nr:hypothetical protein C8J56DRAFT_174128 [Mycena floridula]